MGDGAVRGITDLFTRLGSRRPEPAAGPAAAVAPHGEPAFPTKAFRKFLSVLTAPDNPILVDLGPVVGSNVSFFGERFGCKIYIEDLYGDVGRHAREGALEALPGFLAGRFGQDDRSVDGVLCWDMFDYLDRPAARALAAQLVRIVRPGGAVLGFFSTAEIEREHYTKYVVLDEDTLIHRSYPAPPVRQAPLLNRDIIKLFDGLVVSDSFLLKINTREILFRRPGGGARG